MSDIVWWTKAGRVLHRDPDCPPFARARVDALRRMERRDYEAADSVRSYDFAHDTMALGQDTYPPEHRMLCLLCGHKESKP